MGGGVGVKNATEERLDGLKRGKERKQYSQKLTKVQKHGLQWEKLVEKSPVLHQLRAEGTRYSFQSLLSFSSPVRGLKLLEGLQLRSKSTKGRSQTG